MNLRFAHIAVLPLIAHSVAIAASAMQAAEDPVMTNQGADEMAQAFAFVKGQEFLAQKLAKEYPAMATDLSQSMLKFEASFKPAFTNLDRILLEKNNHWAESRVAIVKSGESNAFSAQVSFEQAQGFAQTLRNRATGLEMPSPVYENLLLCHPYYIERPSEEMLKGYTKAYTSANKEKANGIAIKLKYPASWKAIEGERPNILQRFVSQHGRGFEMVLLQVKPIPADALAELSSPKEKEDLFAAESMKSFMPDGARFIKSDRIKLDGVSGGCVEFSQLQQRLSEKFRMRAQSYFVLKQNCLVGVHCSVNLQETNSDEELEARFKQFEPVFKMIANSVIFEGQWQSQK